MPSQKISESERQAEIEASNDALLTALSSHEKRTTYSSGEVIFTHGACPEGVYVLREGTADLLFSGKGAGQPLQIDAGNVLGLSSLVSNRNHEYTATAAEAAIVGFVDRATFFRVLNQSPERWFDVLRILSRDISSCYDRVRELAERRGA